MSRLEVREIGPISGETEVRLAEGATAVGFGGGGPSAIKTFKSNGTWTNPGVSMIMVEVQGAGSSGRATPADYVRGSGGGYAKKLIDVSSISSATITVGSGGVAVPTNGGAGNAGGSSIYSDGTNTVTGGGGSAHGTLGPIVASGGVASGGDLNINGQSSGKWPTPVVGYSFLGFVDPFNGEETDYEPIAGYGGGGGHGYTSYPSRPGGDGIVIVTEY